MPEETLVDAKGLSCPLPVVKTKEAIDRAKTGDRIVTLVDNEAARENVSRMAKGRGCEVEVEGEGPEIRVLIQVGEGARTRAAVAGGGACGTVRVVAYVNKDKMGHGEQDLGAILMKAFLQTFKDIDPRPEKVIFVNAGVFLTTEGSKVLPVLKDMEKRGMAVVSCGTCLDYYKRMEKVEVGIVSNMYEIVSLLASADRVVSP